MLDLSFFRGARPKMQGHLLEKGEAKRAVNCRMQTGALEAFRGSTVIQAASLLTVKTIHKYGDTNFWFEFENDADVINGPIASDTETTVYFTGDGAPAMTYASIATAGAPAYPSNRYRLGIPAPETAMGATVQGSADPDDENPESRAYVVTYVSARGEEGPPSPPSVIVDVFDGQDVSLVNIPTVPTGNYNITAKRIYRTATGAGDTNYLYVTELPVNVSSFVDFIPTDSLGELIPSVDWVQPPDDMIGLTAAENGVMAGFAGKELFLSEAYLPHAWPHSLTMDHDIVGLVGIRGGLVVATTGKPVIVGFTSPAAAIQTTIETPRACVSKRSMVDMGEFAVFATGDGLVAVDGAGNAPLITNSVLDRYQWQQYNPETIHAYRKEGWYLAFYEGQQGNGGFAITPQGDNFFELDFYADAGFTDPKTGDLYLLINDNIVKWDDDAANLIPFTWESGDVLLPKPSNMAVARVDAEAYPVTFTVNYESNQYGPVFHTRSVNGPEPFWLPDNALYRRFNVEISGTNTVRRVLVAEQIESLT